jgi:hypothetical protein
MSSKEENRKLTLDHMVDEKFAEIYFIAKEEYEIEDDSPEEKLLYDTLNKFKIKLKKKCEHHFRLEDENE